MAGRAIWSGDISFGLVTIPVKLHSATSEKDISFNLIHATCGTRIQQKRWCPTDEVEVPWSEIVRGYEYAKGRYVTLTDEDFQNLPLPSTHLVDLTAFVEAAEIDPVYYERSYYLAPEERGRKAYALLLEALTERELVAIATVTLRRKEQLCAIRAHDGTLLLDTLYYPDEVHLEREVDLSTVKIGAAERRMANALIDLLRKPFDPAEYHDRYRDALRDLIDAKLEGKEIAPPPRREPKVIDLSDALARSLAAAKGRGRGRGKSPRSASAPARRTRRRSERKAG
jgi:DNA end-binding protein Ku